MNTKLLLTKISYVILSLAGLDNQQTGRWTRQPQPVTHQRTVRTIFPNTGLTGPVFHLPTVFGGMGREPKKTPPLCLPLVWHCLAATRSTLHKHQCKALTMLYTFLIAQRGQRLAQVRTRTISAIAQNETKARQQLQGLPLVFVRCTPTKGAAV